MDTTLLIAGITVLFIALIWVGYLYFRLRRRMRDYSAVIWQASRGEIPATTLPLDVPQIETLSSAIHDLGDSLTQKNVTLDAERARLAAILDQMTDGVLIADPRGIIQFANPAAEKLFDIPQANGHTVAEAVRHHQLVEAWQRCQQHGGTQTETAEIPQRQKYIQLVVIPDQHAGGTILLAQDLTRVRRLETVRRDFVSNVSHELRTPLASLRALTETLQDGALDDPLAAHRFVGRIQTEVDALTQMASELLELTRIESGQLPLEFSTIPPVSLLNSAVERMRAQAERAGIALSIDCPPDLPEVRADTPRLEQVLVNLIHNSVKFTSPGGSILLSAGNDEKYVRFVVHDTGVGIPAEDLLRIFERFYRVDRSRAGGGTGLGLSIARHIVEAHGGRIWAESEEGRGSSLFFTIPVA
jgi:two-component system phosphate regulon sensor histidine kinase PhoR